MAAQQLTRTGLFLRAGLSGCVDRLAGACFTAGGDGSRLEVLRRWCPPRSPSGGSLPRPSRRRSGSVRRPAQPTDPTGERHGRPANPAPLGCQAACPPAPRPRSTIGPARRPPPPRWAGHGGARGHAQRPALSRPLPPPRPGPAPMGPDRADPAGRYPPAHLSRPAPGDGWAGCVASPAGGDAVLLLTLKKQLAFGMNGAKR